MRHLLVGATALNAIALFGLTGGWDIGGIMRAVMAPLIAVTIASQNCGIAWTGVLFVSLIATATSVRLGYNPSLPVDSDIEALWSLWAAAGTLLLSLVIALGYDRLRRDTLAIAESERLSADRAHAEQLEAEARFRSQLETLEIERAQTCALTSHSRGAIVRKAAQDRPTLYGFSSRQKSMLSRDRLAWLRRERGGRFNRGLRG